MWKYLKDYLIGKLVDKWILQTDLNINQPQMDYFLHFTNIEINPETLTNSLNRHFNLQVTSGSIEELIVEVNWTEIFRYWTEVKAKYHFEEEEDESERELDNAKVSSNIKLKNLKLNLVHCEVESVLLDDNFNPDLKNFNTDLIKDFMDHIIGQFEVEIENLTITIDDKLIIETSGIVITSEINGLRKLSITGDFDIKDTSKNAKLCLKTGTEVALVRTIEDFQVKVNFPEISLEFDALDRPFDFQNVLKQQSNCDYSTVASFEIFINLISVKIASNLGIQIHDTFINEAGAFVVGHFECNWQDRSVFVDSPVQTHVITGNYKTMEVEIDEEISVNIGDLDALKQLEELINVKDKRREKENNSKSFNIRIRTLNCLLNDYKAILDNFTFEKSKISVEHVELSCKESQLNISNVAYYISNIESRSSELSPFREMKKFIENDEILLMETEEVLYSQYFDVDKLEIGSVKGQLNIKDFITSSTNNANNSEKKFCLRGQVEYVDLSVKLDNFVSFNLNLNDFRVLLTEEFIDLRVQLNNLMRESDIWISKAKIGAVFTRTEKLVQVDGINLIVPHDIYEKIVNDFKYLEGHMCSSRADKSNLQVTVNGLIMELRHRELQVPVKSTIFIEEFHYKTGILYTDNLCIDMNDQCIFNSGLLKFNLETRNLKNYCSDLTLTAENFENLLLWVQFWSDVYTPVIEEIRPDAIFTESLDFSESDCEAEEFSLEIDFSDGDELGLEDSVEETIPHDSIDDLAELLEDIDEEFFVEKKKKAAINDNCNESRLVGFSDCRFRLNLVLPDGNQVIAFTLIGINGSVSREGMSVKIREGQAIYKDKLILTRWSRGPDVTNKYQVEDGNFLSIRSEKASNESIGIDEINLIISASPLRLFLEQNLLNQLARFFKTSAVKVQNSDSEALKAFIFFNRVSISSLAIKLDYKVNVSTLPPLNGAEIILPRIELRGIKGLQGLGPAICSAWIPELKGKKLTGVLKTGLVPVRTIVNVGGGVAELILLPWQLGEGQSAARIVSQIRKNGKLIGLETLKLTTILAKKTSTLLDKNTDTPGINQQPSDFQTGVQQATQIIIALPARFKGNKKGPLKAVPLFILDSAAAATGAIAKTLQGIQAEFDKGL